MSDFTEERMQEIMGHDAYPECQVAIETGTGWADTTALLAHYFDRVITIELSQELYGFVSRNKRLKSWGVEFIHGDSVVKVPELCRQIEEPCFWYLDAHWCQGGKFTGRTSAMNPSPLFDELAAIAARKYADVVVVDDVHAFGRNANWDKTRWWEVTEETILRALGSRVRTSMVNHDQFVVYTGERNERAAGD